jgi:hypothetical protein
LTSGHGAVDLIKNLAHSRSGKALASGEGRPRRDLARLQLTQPFDGALARIEPLTGGALLRWLSRRSEIQDDAGREILLEELLGSNCTERFSSVRHQRRRTQELGAPTSKLRGRLHETARDEQSSLGFRPP